MRAVAALLSIPDSDKNPQLNEFVLHIRSSPDLQVQTPLFFLHNFFIFNLCIFGLVTFINRNFDQSINSLFSVSIIDSVRLDPERWIGSP